MQPGSKHGLPCAKLQARDLHSFQGHIIPKKLAIRKSLNRKDSGCYSKTH